MESRLTNGSALGAGRGGGAGDRPLGEIFRELRMPCPRRFADRALCGHPFLDRSAAVVTLVRLHLVPPPLENPPTITRNA